MRDEFGSEDGPRPSAAGLDRARTFIAYGDSCSGSPGTPHAANLARIHQALLAVAPRPEFVIFAGDHVQGYTPTTTS